jgi:hypothetical protein
VDRRACARPVVGTKVITRRLAVSSPDALSRAERDVQHADVTLFQTTGNGNVPSLESFNEGVGRDVGR